MKLKNKRCSSLEKQASEIEYGVKYLYDFFSRTFFLMKSTARAEKGRLFAVFRKMKLLRQDPQVSSSRRFIALILLFAMILSLTASFSAFGIEEKPVLISPKFVGTPGIDDIPFCIDEDVIFDAEHTVRLRYLETEDNIAAFSNPDGSATMYYFSNPIKYTDLYGSTVDIDNTIVAFEDASEEYKFKTKSAPATTYLPATIGRGNDVRVEYDGYSIEIMPISDRDADATTIESELKSKRDAALLYRDVFGEGRSLKYTTLYNGVKEDIILESYVPDENSFKFNITTSGLELTKIDGKYILRNKLGLPIFELSEVFVFDSSEDMNTTGGKYSVEELKPNEIYSITVTVDEEWLKNATYPVTIDPTVIYDDSEGLEDAYSKGTTYNLTGYETQLIIGDVTNESSPARTYIRFPNLVNTLEMDSDIIESAKLHLTVSSNTMETNPSNISIHHITSGWVEYHWSGSYPYNSYNQSTAVSKDYSISGTGSKEFNITPFVRRFVDNDYIDSNGLLIKSKDESLNGKIVFYSSEFTETSKRPYITVTLSSYSIPNGKQQGIRDDRFYWVSSDDQFLTKSDSRPDIIYSGQARDYTLLKQRFLFTYDENEGKYRISTENAPTTYLTVSGSYLVGSSISSSDNQLWHIGCTNNGYYFIISAGDTSKSLALNNSIACLTTGTITSWTFEKCPTFYSQDIGTINGHQYWDTTHLNNLYFTSYSTTKMFLADDSSSDIMHSGCVMSSFAMVLDNLNIKTSEPHIDFRVSMTISNYLIPDPFTCTMANTAWKQITYDGTKYVASGYSSNPVLTIWGTISSNFSFSYKTDDFNITDNERYKIFFDQNNATTVKQKALMLAQVLENNPAGVMLRVGNNNHTIVVTKYKGYTTEPTNDKGWDDLFIVYDPAASTLSAGSGCIWSACETYGSYKGLANATYITILTP